MGSHTGMLLFCHFLLLHLCSFFARQKYEGTLADKLDSLRAESMYISLLIRINFNKEWIIKTYFAVKK